MGIGQATGDKVVVVTDARRGNHCEWSKDFRYGQSVKWLRTCN